MRAAGTKVVLMTNHAAIGRWRRENSHLLQPLPATVWVSEKDFSLDPARV